MDYYEKPWDVPCPVCGANAYEPCKKTHPTAYHSGRAILSDERYEERREERRESKYL